MKGLPGQEETIRLGYELGYHSGDKSSATYSKGELNLTVYEKGTASLSAMYKMVLISVANFSFPNKNFHIFENQILTVLKGIK